MFNAKQNNGVLQTEDYSKIEELFALHFQEGANIEISNPGPRRESETNPLCFTAFDAARKRVTIRQLPDRRPFILFHHRFDYTGYPQWLRWLRGGRCVRRGVLSRHDCESRAAMR